MSDLGFWQKLKKPILALAPMADVTDCAFRQIIAKYSNHGKFTRNGESRGGPDVFFTEFVSVDGLCHKEAREKLLIDLKYGNNEHPIVAQIFGSRPENFEKVARMLVKMGFDGIDINMGCPVKKVINQCSCSALIHTPDLAKEIVLATKRGAGDIPVSVKTRIGFNKIEIDTWIPAILESNPAALTIHLRTVKEMSKVPAHWDLVKRIVEIRDKMKKETLIIGNGDVLGINDAKRKCEEYNCDGVMLGRAIFGNPWLFDSTASNFFSLRTAKPNSSLEKTRGSFVKERLNVMLEHTKLFEKMLGEHKNFALMKKHYKAYVNGFPATAGRDGAKELRVKLMEAENAKQVEIIVNDFLAKIC